ncbi:MAG: hypothetical protein R2752_13490 [Vicinamibacterales bacterium]
MTDESSYNQSNSRLQIQALLAAQDVRLLSVPVLAVDDLIDDLLAKEPELLEALATSRERSGTASFSLQAAIRPTPVSSVAGRGTGPILEAGLLEAVGGRPCHAPDVQIVAGRGRTEATVSPYPHCLPRDVKIPADLSGRPRNVLREAIALRNWLARALLEVYTAVAQVQSEFLSSLDVLRLNPAPIAELLRLGLPHSESTYSRMLQGRTVEVAREDGAVVIPVRVLMPPRTQVVRFRNIHLLNRQLVDERRMRTALSDRVLADRAGTLARRTVAKMRSEADPPVPDRLGRQRLYDEGREGLFAFEGAYEHRLRELLSRRSR